MSWPGVTAAIVGARAPEQVDDWIDAGNLELSRADLDEIARAIERTGAGTGPSTPKTQGKEYTGGEPVRKGFVKGISMTQVERFCVAE